MVAPWIDGMQYNHCCSSGHAMTAVILFAIDPVRKMGGNHRRVCNHHSQH